MKALIEAIISNLYVYEFMFMSLVHTVTIYFAKSVNHVDINKLTEIVKPQSSLKQAYIDVFKRQADTHTNSFMELEIIIQYID